MERVLKKGLMAIMPEYIDYRGNCTILYGRAIEPLIIEKKVNTVLQAIAKYYMIDLKEIKKRYGSILPNPNLVPIPFSKKDVFIPVKTRIPLTKNDGAFGYVNIRYIEKVKKDKEYSIIQLNNGLSFKALCSISTMDKHIKNGKIISRCYMERTMMVADDEILYMEKF